MDKERGKRLGQAIGLEISRARERIGMTQEALAELLQVGPESISRMERGVVMPSIARLYELAVLFDCRVEDFLSKGGDRLVHHDRVIAEMLADLSAEDRDAMVQLIDLFASRLRSARGERKRR